ncbi:AAA family ATPase [Pseudonocardia spinosispora]|uniref:AAA family ATPase n=1 Tax=Pseudonocardia spinosispora TaxID=103441 RepID=UPI0009FFEC33|nr:AAA family ATPase [Pseudonocardia spinosispora]
MSRERGHTRPAYTLRGRSAEVSVTLEMLRAVTQGRSGVVLLRGEPGIGKTALLTTVVEQAARLGFHTAHSTAHEDDRVASLASLAPALRFGVAPLIDSADFMDLARLHEQPLWLAERLAMLLERRAQDGPILLALDDAHWSDPLTAFVLRVLPKRLLAAPIAWVLTTRPVPGGGPAARMVEAAAPDLQSLSVELTALDWDAVRAVALDRLGKNPDAAVLHKLSGARGDPFLTVQLLDGLFEPGAGEESTAARVPTGLLEGVRRRMSTTSEPCREVVRVAAVLGHGFLLSDVAALLDAAAPTQLTDPLSEAIDAGLLTDDGSSIQFRHELLREAVYYDLPPSARHSVHRAFAERLLTEGRGYALAAPHVLVTARRGDTLAVDVLRKAAHEVLGTMSVTSAMFIRQAFDLTYTDDPAWGEIAAEVVRILGAARQFTEQRRFADMLLATPISPDLHARVRLTLLPRLWSIGRSTELAELTCELADDPRLDARLAGYRALAQGATIETAVSDEDPIATVLARTAAAQWAERAEYRRRAYELFAEARALAQGVSGHGAPETGQLAARELIALGRLDDIDGALGGLADANRFGDSWQAPQLALLRGQLQLAAGRVDEAAQLAAAATDLMAELHDHAFDPALRELLAMVALLRGDHTEARTQLAAASDVPGDLSLVSAVLAVHDNADAVIAEVRAGAPLWSEQWLVSLACSAHHRGNQKSVHDSRELLADLAERNPDLASCVGAHLLVEALFNHDYQAARDALRTSPRTLLVLRADEEFGRFELDAGDRSVALTVLDAVRDHYAELGATASASRVQRILQASGVRRRRWTPAPQRPETGWEALTEMERQVALLVAGGHTNRSAAEELVLSPNTISTHLRAVFTKLDVHSRVQLANLVQRNDTDRPDTGLAQQP